MRILDYKVIVDSCCDVSKALFERFGFHRVPLTLTLGEKEYIDDEELDMPRFMADMKACKHRVGSAAPAPFLYRQAMDEEGNAFVVTLSEKLSASYNNALIGKNMADDDSASDVHVIDSKSASAGETLVAIKLWELIGQGLHADKIVNKITEFIKSMKTYFVLENYDNLIKSGRISKVTSTIAGILNIRLVMGSDGDGSICLTSKVRGAGEVIDKLLSLIKDSGRKIEGENFVISHCNNPELASNLSDAVCKQFNFKEVFVVPTGGLSSLYADNKGIIMAF